MNWPVMSHQRHGGYEHGERKMPLSYSGGESSATIVSRMDYQDVSVGRNQDYRKWQGNRCKPCRSLQIRRHIEPLCACST